MWCRLMIVVDTHTEVGICTKKTATFTSNCFLKVFHNTFELT